MYMQTVRTCSPTAGSIRQLMQVGLDLMLEASPQAVRRKSLALFDLFAQLVRTVSRQLHAAPASLRSCLQGPARDLCTQRLPLVLTVTSTPQAVLSGAVTALSQSWLAVINPETDACVLSRSADSMASPCSRQCSQISAAARSAWATQKAMQSCRCLQLTSSSGTCTGTSTLSTCCTSRRSSEKALLLSPLQPVFLCCSRLQLRLDLALDAAALVAACPSSLVLSQALIARGVTGDFRPPDTLRFGLTPLYTRYVDIWDAVQHLKQIMEAAEHQQPRFQTRQLVP